MTFADWFPILVGIVGGLILILVGIVGWLFQRVWSMLGQIFAILRTLEGDLRGDLLGLERRLTTIEIKCLYCHHQPGGKAP